MGQHMEKVNETESLSDLGYTYTKSVYQAKNCKKCPLRDSCNRAAGNRKIEVNHKNNAYRAKARELLDSEQGRYYRGRRSIEPEAVFGQIKHNHNFRRFHLKSLKKVSIEFGLVALAHNLRKYASIICPKKEAKQSEKQPSWFILYLHTRILIGFCRIRQKSSTQQLFLLNIA